MTPSALLSVESKTSESHKRKRALCIHRGGVYHIYIPVINIYGILYLYIVGNNTTGMPVYMHHHIYIYIVEYSLSLRGSKRK